MSIYACNHIYTFSYRAFEIYDSVKAAWEQDKEFLGQGVAADIFDSSCLEGARSYARRKHL